MVGKKILKYSFISLAAVSVLSFAIVPLLKSNQNLTDIGLPIPGTKILQSENFVPVYLKGLRLDPNRPDQIDFYIDTGSQNLSEKKLKEETNKLVDYFLASLTVPTDDLWVNLSPYEKDRIIPDALGDTDMGSQLLAQDYILKQLTASLSDPETKLGQEYWKEFNSDKLKNSFNKVWIVPETAKVVEHNGIAVVAESSLKAMMESDYNALKHNKIEVNEATTNSVMRDKMLPIIENEVNSGKNFAPLRQAYSAMILSSWFKKSVRGHDAYDQYKDSAKTKGIDSEDQEMPSKIYVQYVDAFDKGVYKYVKTEKDAQGESIKKQYLSGGFSGAAVNKVMASAINADLVSIELDNTIGESRIATYKMKEINEQSSAVTEFENYIVSGSTVPLDEKLVGLKSKNQIISKNELGLPVPEFAIITTDFMRDNIDNEDVDWLGLAEAVLQDPEIQKIPDGSTLAIRPAGEINMPGLAETIKGIEKDPAALAEVLKRIAQDWTKGTVESYRKKMGIADNSMFAFMIQREVMGNLNENSGSGVFYTRNPVTGENQIVGNYCVNAPGEYIRNGEGDRPYLHVESSMQMKFPQAYAQIEEYKKTLEKHFKYPQEVEFVIEDGELFIVQTVKSDLSNAVESEVLKSMHEEGIVRLQDVTNSLYDMEVLHVYEFKKESKLKVITDGVNLLSEGAMAGELCFDLDKAKTIRANGKKAIIVSPFFNDNIQQAVINKEIDGVIVGKGTQSMHAARIAREALVPAIVLGGMMINDSQLTVVDSVFREISFAEGDFIAFDESSFVVPAANDIEVLQLKEAITKKKLELEKIDDVKNKVFNFMISNDHDYQKAVFMHAILYANIHHMQTVEHDSGTAIGLDMITTSIHRVANYLGAQLGLDNTEMKFEIAELERDLSAVIFDNPEFLLSSEEIEKITSPQDFMLALDKKTEKLKERYQSLQISEVLYPNYHLGANQYASNDTNIYVEFSLLFENPMIFSGESVKLIEFLNEMKFSARYQTSKSRREWSSDDSDQMPDLDLKDVNIFADPVDPMKMRVQANINFPEHDNRVTFTLRAKSKNNDVWLDIGDSAGITIMWKQLMTKEERIEHIRKSNRAVSLSDGAKSSVDLGDLSELQDSVLALVHRNTERSYAKLLTRSLVSVGSYSNDVLVKQKSVDEFSTEFFVGDNNEYVVWEIDDQQYKLREHGQTINDGAFDKTVEYEIKNENRDYISALAEMINVICEKELAVVKEIETFRSDSVDFHTTTYDQYYRNRWLSIDRKAVDIIVSGIYDLQTEYDMSDLVLFNDGGQIKDVELEKMVSLLYDLNSKDKLSSPLKGGFDFSGAFLTVEGGEGSDVYARVDNNKIGQLLGLEPQLLAIKDRDGN